MKINWISALIVASAVAIVALIAFQVRWIQHSQRLLEERFNQQVNMALCNTVEKLAGEGREMPDATGGCALASTHQQDYLLDTLLQSPFFDQTLRASLTHHRIDLPFTARILPNEAWTAPAELPPYSCTLDPLIATDRFYLQLDFADKQRYILRQMGGMVGSSIFIILFICAIFGLATYHLVRQKKISDLNREFFNHMAHEFRTPLTNIRLAGKMLEKRDAALLDSPYLGIIRQEGEHLMQQVEQVLHLARLEKSDYPLQKRATDMAALLRETVQSMELRRLECAADIQLELPAYPIVDTVDPLHLSNALRNLLDNSLKYCSRVPRILIRLFRTDDSVDLMLIDNGQGMETRDWKKAFEKFYRGEGSAYRKGFGLGLPYVQRVVELHGGRIHISSQRETGTVFHISLPR